MDNLWCYHSWFWFLSNRIPQGFIQKYRDRSIFGCRYQRFIQTVYLDTLTVEGIICFVVSLCSYCCVCSNLFFCDNVSIIFVKLNTGIVKQEDPSFPLIGCRVFCLYNSCNLDWKIFFSHSADKDCTMKQKNNVPKMAMDFSKQVV